MRALEPVRTATGERGGERRAESEGRRAPPPVGPEDGD